MVGCAACPRTIASTEVVMVSATTFPGAQRPAKSRSSAETRARN